MKFGCHSTLPRVSVFWLVLFCFSGHSSPLLTGISKGNGFSSFIYEYADGLRVHQSCQQSLGGTPPIGSLSADEENDLPLAFFIRHLNSLKSAKVSDSVLYVDSRGDVSTWSSGPASEGGEAVFFRNDQGLVEKILFLVSPDAAAVLVLDRNRINEIVDIIDGHYRRATVTKADNGFYLAVAEKIMTEKPLNFGHDYLVLR